MTLIRFAKPVYIMGASSISPAGFEWKGLSKVSAQESHTVADIPKALECGDHRAHKLMSRGARLAAVALRAAIVDAGWNAECTDAGAFMGVGASGGSMQELTEMLRASMIDASFSLEAFGTQGLAACNPLFAFQLMNNFTLCHGSILNGLSGSNAAFYSRGQGTLLALLEAASAIAEGDALHALAGGADSAHHPVTMAELRRDGFGAMIPSEGAAVLALSGAHSGALACIESCCLTMSGLPPLDALDALDALVIAPWGSAARETLRSLAIAYKCPVLDTTELLGESLAATPAFAWVQALDLIANAGAHRVLAIHAGVDGRVGAVLLRSAS
jgi:hypothetical protein